MFHYDTSLQLIRQSDGLPAGGMDVWPFRAFCSLLSGHVSLSFPEIDAVMILHIFITASD